MHARTSGLDRAPVDKPDHSHPADTEMIRHRLRTEQLVGWQDRRARRCLQDLEKAQEGFASFLDGQLIHSSVQSARILYSQQSSHDIMISKTLKTLKHLEAGLGGTGHRTRTRTPPTLKVGAELPAR